MYIYKGTRACSAPHQFYAPSILRPVHALSVSSLSVGTTCALPIIVQSTADGHLAETYAHSWDSPTSMVTSVPMAPYQIALRFEMEALFGTANQAVVLALVPSVLMLLIH